MFPQIAKAFWNYFKSRKKTWRFAKGCLVIAGALLSGPLWLPFLTVFLESKTGVTINEPSPFLAIPILIIGGITVLVPELLESKHQNEFASKEQVERRNHDREYVENIRKLLPEEMFNTIVSSFGDDHSLSNADSRILSNLSYELEKKETGFLDEEMNLLAQKYLVTLDDLHDFKATQFFYLDNSSISDRTYLFPEGNWDRGCPTPEQELRYGKLQRELNTKLDDLILARDCFLKAAREKLLLVT